MKDIGILKFIAASFLLSLLMAASVFAETASRIELIDGTTYENVTYTVDRDNRRLVIDDGDWTRHISFNDILRIVGADGSDQTAGILGRKPTPDPKTSSRREVEPARNGRPFRFAAVFTANMSTPSGGYFEGFEGGIGASTDLILPVSHKFAIRLLLSRSGAHIGDVFVTDYNVNETINLSDYVSSEVWHYAVALQYYSWPNRENGGKKMYSLYVGLGPFETVMKPQVGDPRFSAGSETIGALTIGAGFDWLIAGRLSLASIVQVTTIVGHYERRPIHYFIDGSDGGPMTDFKLGLSIFM